MCVRVCARAHTCVHTCVHDLSSSRSLDFVSSLLLSVYYFENASGMRAVRPMSAVLVYRFTELN